MKGHDILLYICLTDWGIASDQKSDLMKSDDDTKRDLLRIAVDLDGLYRTEESIRGYLNEHQLMLKAIPINLIFEGKAKLVREHVAFLSGR